MFFIICILSILIIWQDFKNRSLHLFLLIAFWGTTFLIGKDSLATSDYILNIGFIALQLLILTIYFSIKEQKFINIIDRYLGLGDILFFIGLAFLFPFASFVLFFLISIGFAILFSIISTIRKHSISNNIPLAGLMAIPLLCIICIQWIGQVSPLESLTQLLYDLD